MSKFLVLKVAALRIDDIYQYSQRNWGTEQANKYIEGLFNHFEDIVSGNVLLRPIPAEFEVEGYVSCYEKHLVYSKTMKSGEIGIVTVLHQRMHMIERFSEDFRFF
jgi:plasmid stabilization system protein ParE